MIYRTVLWGVILALFVSLLSTQSIASEKSEGQLLELRTLGLTAASLAAIHFPLDTAVKNLAVNGGNSATKKMGSIGYHAGHVLLPIIGTGYLGGLITGNDQMTSTFGKALKSAVISSTATKVGKMAFHRYRPHSGESANSMSGFKLAWAEAQQSFPSGHSSLAWSVFTVLAEENKSNSVLYWGSYSAATFIASSRILANDHWLSDVVVGSLIGYVSAKSVLGSGPTIFSEQVKLEPYTQGDFYGVGFNLDID